MSTLAIDGGHPVLSGSWPAWPPAASEEQRRLVTEVVDSGRWGATSGGLCDRLAEEFARRHGCEHGVCVVNGTLGLTVAMMALGLEPGDEVIVPSYTFVACATSALLMGVVPVLVDVDPEHLHLTAETIEPAISERTRAIMVVHLAGSPAPMTEILELAARHGLAVVEDSAQAHGATYRGTSVGALGALGTFSFQSSKAMTAGEGGLITTLDNELADRAWSACNVGRVREGAWYHHGSIGWNLRMTELQAALLLPWIPRLGHEIATRNRFADAFQQSLSEAGTQARLLPDPPGTTLSSRHLGLLDLGGVEADAVNRGWCMEALAAEGLQVDDGYPGLTGIGSVSERSRCLPTPGVERARRSVVWLRQDQMMAATTTAEAAAEAVVRVMSDARSRASKATTAS